MTRLLILGASGHGRVVGDCARAAGGWTDIQFCDGRWPELKSCLSWPVVGSDIGAIACDEDETFVAIGNSSTRLSALRSLQQAQRRIAVIVHPRACVSADAFIYSGTIVVAGAIINIGAIVGRGSIINTGATVDHDCELGEGVHICPGTHLAGDVKVGRGSWIGIGSAVRQGVHIGADVTVGAGSVVVHDIADGLTVVGVPAKPLPQDRPETLSL